MEGNSHTVTERLNHLLQSDKGFEGRGDHDPALKRSTDLVPTHPDLASQGQGNKDNPNSQVSCIYLL